MPHRVIRIGEDGRESLVMGRPCVSLAGSGLVAHEYYSLVTDWLGSGCRKERMLR
jgi:hypothetical protein